LYDLLTRNEAFRIQTVNVFFRGHATISPGLQELVASPEKFGCSVIYDVFDTS